MGRPFIEVLISWAPMILLIGAYLIFIRLVANANRTKSGKTYPELLEEYLAHQKRNFELTETLLERYETRIRQLEDELSRQQQKP